MKNWEIFKGSALHPELSGEVVVQNVQAATNVKRTQTIFGPYRRVFNNMKTGEWEQQEPQLPGTFPSSLLINLLFPFWSLSAPFLSGPLIARTPLWQQEPCSVPRPGPSAFVCLVGWWLFVWLIRWLVGWMDGWVVFPFLLSLKNLASMLGALGLASPNTRSFPKSLSH